MASKQQQLHVLLFPFMGYGHMIPMVDLAMAFAARGVRATLLLSPRNYTAAIEASINQFNNAGGGHAKIAIRTIPFPVPVKSENTDSVASEEEGAELIAAVEMLEQPFRELVQQLAPDCMVSDMLLPWTAEVAHDLGIPRLVFNGFSYMSMCMMNTLHRFKPEKELESDTEPFTVPGLPDPIALTRAQVPAVADDDSSPLWRVLEKIMKADSKSYGTIMNSFRELEEAYVKHCAEVDGKKTWHVGPLSLCTNRDINQKLVMTRGKTSSIDPQECVDWLNTKGESSVLYVCFGSVIKFAATQIVETAAALESSSCSFIWVVKSCEVLPEGFEERNKEKGMVIRGWAPQVVIIGHPAIGGIVTHCGWNSALEGISSGLPMITWPGFADQFYNEKLITQVLKVGVEVGVKRQVKWEEEVGEVVVRDAIEVAIRKLMGDGEESRGLRRRAKMLGDMARKAIGEGGSSFLSCSSLIEE